mgnify:CR=1 FL=1|jgi:translation initiation factor 3 subunit F
MSLFLDETDAPRIQVHPLVVMSILDAYMRRQRGLTRVIGTLLGTRTANLVEITSCFCVPHQQGADGTIAFDDEYNKKMLQLKKMVSHGEEIVGWFSTAPPAEEAEEEAGTQVGGGESGAFQKHALSGDVDFMTAYIHDHYSQAHLGADTLHLVVDTACVGDRVNVTGYVGSPLALGGDPLAAQFHAVRVDVTASSTEKIACDMMIKAAVAEASAAAAGGVAAAAAGVGGASVAGGGVGGGVDSLAGDLDSLETSVVRLLEILDTNSDYVQGVLAGKTEQNDAVGKEIFKALAAVPRMDPEVFGKIFNDRLQDMLMVVYLSNLTRTQLAICDKIAQSDALIGEA